MRLRELGEFGLIGRIQKWASDKTTSTQLGIGDDAAAVRFSASRMVLATTDLLLEGVHFDLAYTDLFSLGWKAAAVNLSDIAAMGGVPRYCLTGIGIPSGFSVKQIADFYRGVNALLKSHKTALIGGDTCASRQGLFISITLLGESEQPLVVTRAGAKPGDRIFVTGTIGDSSAGLEILQEQSRKTAGSTKTSPLIESHLRPTPRIAEGRLLAVNRCASAMIDLSDGLSSDLTHVCEQSRVGAEIFLDRIPISPALRKASATLARPEEHYALSGGEDYELLFTVPASKIRKFLSLGMTATEIGTITSGKKIFIRDGQGEKKPLSPSGYDHFLQGKKQVPSLQ